MTESDTIPAVEAVVARASASFARTLGRYLPWLRPDRSEQRSGNTERNLTFQLALAFCAIYADSAFAAMEVPLVSRRRRYEDHLDAYLFSSQLAILLECKVHSGSGSLAEVVADIDRMTPAVFSDIRKRHQPEPLEASETVSMVLVEAWGREGGARKSCRDRWLDEAGRAKWSGGSLRGDWHYDAKKIFTSKSGENLYWLYSYRHLAATA
jgi:hypothetical protein